MNNLLTIKNILLTAAIMLSAHINAIPKKKNCKPLASIEKAKIAGVYALMPIYVLQGLGHLGAFYNSVEYVLKGDESEEVKGYRYQRNEVAESYMQRMIPILAELGGIYCSIFTLKLLSTYKQKIKGCKPSPNQLSNVPAEFNNDEEDVDKVFFEILLHVFVVISALYLTQKYDYSPYAFLVKKMINKNPQVEYNISRFAFFKRLLFNWQKAHARLKRIILSPFFAPAKLYTAYCSYKTICSKLKLLLSSYKKELPKIYLSNSNGSQ